MKPLKLYHVALATILAVATGTVRADNQVPARTDCNGAEWWIDFNDTVLNSLIQRGINANYNLKSALSRIESAKNASNLTRAGYYPTLGVAAGWNASHASGRTSHTYAETATVDYFSLGANMSWEIDLFGRIRAQLNSDKAGVKLSAAEYDAVVVSMTASIAKAYITLRQSQAQLEILNSQLETDKKILHITEVRKDVGLSSALDVAQAKTVVLTTESEIPALEESIRTSIYSIALLTGRHPEEGYEALAAPLPIPEYSGAFPTGDAATLLANRADVRESEASLEQTAAQVGIAKKDWLPTLSVAASAGTSASNFGKLFSKNSFDWQVAPQLSWTVFEGLARKYKDADARLALEQATDQYNETLLTAYSEVWNARAQYDSAQKQIAAFSQVVDEAEKSLDLALDLYKQGLSDYSDVMNSQISLLNARNSLVAAQGASAVAMVAIFEALGL